MKTVIIVAPFVAELITMAFRPIEARRIVRMGLATLAALLPLLLLGRVPTLSMLFAFLVCGLSWCATLFSTGIYSFDWGVGEAVWSRKSVYFVLLGTFWSAMLLVVLSSTFTMMWLGISMTTLATTFLVGFSGERDSLEAAWKYLVLCSVGIGIALLGVLAWLQTSPQNPALTMAAVALMIVGFATKAGLVPMHAWLPDAHSKAPAPISALLSGVLISCSLYAILRVVGAAEAAGDGAFARSLLLVLGVLSTSVAGILMLVQSDIKRLLAYSTVEHAGLVALALGFGGTLGIFAALFHLFNHALAKSAAFLSAGMVQRGASPRLLLPAMAALCGLPPFGLLISELLIVAAGVAAHQWLALGVAVTGMVLAFIALVRTAVENASVRRTAAPPATKLPRRSLAATGAVLAAAFVVALAPWIGGASVLSLLAEGVIKAR
jgi:hydrogenase-4 component F